MYIQYIKAVQFSNSTHQLPSNLIQHAISDKCRPKTLTKPPNTSYKTRNKSQKTKSCFIKRHKTIKRLAMVIKRNDADSLLKINKKPKLWTFNVMTNE